MWIYLQPQNRSLYLYIIEWCKKLIMYMYLFVLMFSVFVLIFECHLFACKRDEFPSWTNKTELNWKPNHKIQDFSTDFYFDM